MKLNRWVKARPSHVSFHYPNSNSRVLIRGLEWEEGDMFRFILKKKIPLDKEWRADLRMHEIFRSLFYFLFV